MFIYFILRIIYTLYLLGIGVIVWHTISKAIFGKVPLKEFFKSIGTAFIWPISLMSTAGRKNLIKKLKGI